MPSIKKEIQDLFKKYGLRPQKHRGQNFLIERADLGAIVRAAAITPGETVVEVGAGIGNLTRELVAAGARVVAVEKDARLGEILKGIFGDKVEVQIEDVRNFDARAFGSPYKLVGNIPYYLTGEIIRKFLSGSCRPKLIVLTIQKEVGERIVASPPRATFVSMMVRVYGAGRIVRRVRRTHFWPEPKVDSVVLVIKPGTKNNSNTERFVSFLRAGFRQPRKTLLNNLSSLPAVDKSAVEGSLRSLGLGSKTRPHELDLESWRKLYESMNH